MTVIPGETPAASLPESDDSELYIYYRVNCVHAARLRTAVNTMQKSLMQEHRIGAQLKRRPEAQDDRHTWMEIYTGVSGDFEAALKTAVEKARLERYIDGERHVEKFKDANACA